jgi:hypothetical protein
MKSAVFFYASQQQHEALKRIAVRTGNSMGEFVRAALADAPQLRTELEALQVEGWQPPPSRRKWVKRSPRPFTEDAEK